MFCANCGAKIEDGAKFCPNCGAAVGKSVQSATILQTESQAGETSKDVAQVAGNNQATTPLVATPVVPAVAPSRGLVTTKFCRNCGTQIDEKAEICPKCGVRQEMYKNTSSINFSIGEKSSDPFASPKSKIVALLLCIFLGGLGAHRFYVGRVYTGILWLLTLGLFGIGTLVDFIMILCGKFSDGDGRLLLSD